MSDNNAPIDNEKENLYVDDPAPIGTIAEKPLLQEDGYINLAPAGEPLDARAVINDPAPIGDPPETGETEALDQLLARLSPAARAWVLADLGKEDLERDTPTNPAIPTPTPPTKSSKK